MREIAGGGGGEAMSSGVCAVWIADFKSVRVLGTVLQLLVNLKSCTFMLTHVCKNNGGVSAFMPECVCVDTNFFLWFLSRSFFVSLTFGLCACMSLCQSLSL